MKFKQLLNLKLCLSTLVLVWASTLMASPPARSCHNGYLIFVGQDATGKVAFAMENTRSKGDGLDWTQTAQVAWMYDENRGWVDLKGRYGKAFKGAGQRKIGGEWQHRMANNFQANQTIRSDENGIHLKVKANKILYKTKSRDGQMVTATGKGEMVWNGRRIKGTVFLRDDIFLGSSASSMYFKHVKGVRSEAIHLNVPKHGFVSVFRTDHKMKVPIGGSQGISIQMDSISGHTDEMKLEATAYRRLGFYEYPTAWQGSFSIEGKEAMFKVVARDAVTAENILLAGTRLSWLRGFISFDGHTYPVCGFAEVSAILEGKKQIQEAEWRSRPSGEEMPGTTFEAILRN